MNIDEIFLADQIFQDVADAEQEAGRARLHLPKTDSFDLPDDKFIKIFRLSKPLVCDLIEMLTPYL